MKKRSQKRNKKVSLAMSGGVDSSVAAALLKKQGYQVFGFFMRLWPKENNLYSGEDRAKRVAQILDIPFKVFNFQDLFKRDVVDYFIKGYKKGITPNPCIVCNKKIKFGIFFKRALSNGSEYFATGHYARLKLENSSSDIKLLKAKDRVKDQSYFLWTLTQNQLKQIIFPIGEYKRFQVEDLAKKFNLPFEGVKKSQEACFISKTTDIFLKDNLKPKEGKIINLEGETLGSHQGLCLYTIGQRKGIKLPGGPYYTESKDFKNNILFVTKDKKDLLKKELIIENINWLSLSVPDLPIRVRVRIRHRHEPVKATLDKIIGKNKEKRCKLIFDFPEQSIARGQSAVFYRGDQILGGGIISL